MFLLDPGGHPEGKFLSLPHPAIRLSAKRCSTLNEAVAHITETFRLLHGIVHLPVFWWEDDLGQTIVCDQPRQWSTGRPLGHIEMIAED